MGANGGKICQKAPIQVSNDATQTPTLQPAYVQSHDTGDSGDSGADTSRESPVSSESIHVSSDTRIQATSAPSTDNGLLAAPSHNNRSVAPQTPTRYPTYFQSHGIGGSGSDFGSGEATTRGDTSPSMASQSVPQQTVAVSVLAFVTIYVAGARMA